MATKTPNLNLILPANNEYFGIWDQPINKNFTLIDAAVGDLQTEMIDARGSAGSLNERLDAGLNSDGSPIASTEVVAARDSSIYGSLNGAVPFLLDDRLEAGDREAFTARQSQTGLIDAVAWSGDVNRGNTVNSAANNPITFTGAVVTVNGSVTPYEANINGYRQVIRNLSTTTISGGAGTYYLTLTRIPGGIVNITSTGGGGVLSTYAGNGLVAKLSDGTQNFVVSGIKPGDVIQLTAPIGNPNLGTYTVLATNNEDPTNLTVNDIAIVGSFVSTGSGFDYTITNPIQPQLGFTGTAHAKTFTRVNNVIYIGRCVFDGTNVTSLTAYAVQGAYAAFTQVTPSGGNYSLTIPHNIGYFPKRLMFFGSQANDFSSPLDPLSTAEVTGGGSLQRSVIAQATDLNVLVKNATNAVFYKDFSGTVFTSGYIYVIAER